MYLTGELFTTVYTHPKSQTCICEEATSLNKKTLRGIKEAPKWQTDSRAERGVEGYYALGLRGVQ